MTPAQFKAAREALCLSQNDLAEVLGMGANGGVKKITQTPCAIGPLALY